MRKFFDRVIEFSMWGFLLLFFAFLIYQCQSHRNEMAKERREFLKHSQGVVRVTRATFQSGKFPKWIYVVSDASGEKTVACRFNGVDNDRNSSKAKVDEFWKIIDASESLVLTEKTESP